ncbi:hypothetical protein C8R46DRAFT_1140785 [Mycena filopes]|nr:hypothetical protein C8R46DRAFT_1140785 [Mycena filopes]
MTLTLLPPLYSLLVAKTSHFILGGFIRIYAANRRQDASDQVAKRIFESPHPTPLVLESTQYSESQTNPSPRSSDVNLPNLVNGVAASDSGGASLTHSTRKARGNPGILKRSSLVGPKYAVNQRQK